MAQRQVVWTNTASKQRREILEYWINRNDSTVFAEKIIRITAGRIRTILKNPEAFKETSFPDTRVCAMGHFSIFYKTTNTQLIITSFWDNRQDPKRLLRIIANDKQD